MCYITGEHAIDTQGFLHGKLSYWEEAEVNKQIQALIKLGKMKNNDSKYASRVSLHVKRDDNRWLCGDCRPLNMQTRRDSFPMLLIDDVSCKWEIINGSVHWICNLAFGRSECCQMT